MVLFGSDRSQRRELLTLISEVEKERFERAAEDNAVASTEVRAAISRRIEQSTPLRDVVAGVIARQKEMDVRR